MLSAISCKDRNKVTWSCLLRPVCIATNHTNIISRQGQEHVNTGQLKQPQLFMSTSAPDDEIFLSDSAPRSKPHIPTHPHRSSTGSSLSCLWNQFCYWWTVAIQGRWWSCATTTQGRLDQWFDLLPLSWLVTLYFNTFGLWMSLCLPELLFFYLDYFSEVCKFDFLSQNVL